MAAQDLAEYRRHQEQRQEREAAARSQLAESRSHAAEEIGRAHV